MHDKEYRLHLSIHKKISVFDPRNTKNILFLDYLNDEKEIKNRIDRLRSICSSEVNPYVTLLSPIIPSSFRSIMQENVMMWVQLINSFVFNDHFYNLFYAEYCDILDSIVNCEQEDRDSVIYREYKTGHSVFHTAAKVRIVDRLSKDISLPLNKKIKSIDSELKYILKCYEEFGKVFRDGNELTINYMEDYSGIYFKDYITGFVDDLVNGSLFQP